MGISECGIGTELIWVSLAFAYSVDDGQVEVAKRDRTKGLLLNHLSSSPLVYCVSNLDTTSCIVIIGPLDTDDAMPKIEYASLHYTPPKWKLFVKIEYASLHHC